MPQCHHKHPNKRVKVKERAFKQARILKDTLPESPMPSIVIDLGIDKVSNLIRSVTKESEDAYQDAWVAVLEDHVGSAEDILAIAREIHHRHANETIAKEHKEISLDQPIGEYRDEGEFTFKDILRAPAPQTDEEIDHEIDVTTCYVTNSSGKRQVTDRWYLDPDVKAELKRLYPHDILKVAIRKVVGLPQAQRDKRGWYKWEDAIVMRRYPWGGARACALDICRSLNSINHRAKQLGVKADILNSYKPCPAWLNIPELAERLGCKYGVAARLEKTGKIKAIRIPNYHQGHDGVFFTPEAINEYLNSKEIHKQEVAKRRAAKYHATFERKRIAKVEQANAKIRERLRQRAIDLRQLQKEANAKIRRAETILDRYRAIRPEWRRLQATWERLEAYAVELQTETDRVERAWQTFLDVRQVNINSAITKVKQGEHQTAQIGTKVHCVVLEDSDYIALACRPGYGIPIQTFNECGYDPFVNGSPTCSRCLAIKSREKRENSTL